MCFLSYERKTCKWSEDKTVRCKKVVSAFYLLTFFLLLYFHLPMQHSTDPKHDYETQLHVMKQVECKSFFTVFQCVSFSHNLKNTLKGIL